MMLTEFVLARITEDEEFGCFGEGEYGTCADLADRRAVDCAVKRKIVARCQEEVESRGWDDADVLAEHVLALLAQPYQGHPDYRQEWKP